MGVSVGEIGPGRQPGLTHSLPYDDPANFDGCHHQIRRLREIGALSMTDTLRTVDRVEPFHPSPINQNGELGQTVSRVMCNSL